VPSTMAGERSWRPRVVELGSQDVNGTPRTLPILDGCEYVGVDLTAGPGVDVVADARTVTAEQVGGLANIVICTNVYEHVQDWYQIIFSAYGLLHSGGWFITQCAGPGFQVHSGRSATLTLEPDEWYRNVPHTELQEVMLAAGFNDVHTWERGKWPCDTYGVGVR